MVTIKRRGTASSGPTGSGKESATRITIAPAFPLDARLRSVKVQGRSARFAIKRIGDIQRAEVSVDADQQNIEVVYSYDEGTDVFLEREIPVPGAQSKELRILHSRADQDALHLVLEGLGGRSYALSVRSPHQVSEVSGVTVEKGARSATRLLIDFDGPTDTYVRRELIIPFRRRT